jgi:hypothetical protein
MLIDDFSMEVLTTIIVRLVASRAKEYRESRKIKPFPGGNQPIFGAQLHFIREQKYVEISGDAEYIGKILKSLNNE